MAINNLKELFVHTLRDIYYAENQILKSLPKMARRADSADLRSAFEQHKQETEGHVERLDKVFGLLGEKAQGVKCHAIEGIIKEAEELMSEIKDGDTLDAGMIAAVQAVEHYEITRYGTLASWANLLQNREAASLLHETLDEERKTDTKLTELAEASLNKQAIA